jgi:rubredoxin
MEISEQELRKAVGLYKWKCSNCGHIYDDAKKEKLFKDLPEDWNCECGANKGEFEQMPPEE